MSKVKVQFVSEEAKKLYNGELKYATNGSSGFDLRATGFSFDHCKDYLDEDIGYGKWIGDCVSVTRYFTDLEGEEGKTKRYEQHLLECTPTVGAKNASIQMFTGARILVKTGLKMSFNKDCEIQIRPRSGLALKQGVTIVNTPGTIDSDYTGEIGVILINNGHGVFDIDKGDRIAQAVLCPVVKAQFEYVESLEESERGEGGFGSSGSK